MSKKIVLTGCAGFIGSNFVNTIAKENSDYNFFIVDALTYAGRFENISKTLSDVKHIEFTQADIRDSAKIDSLFDEIKPDGVIHFAAESHVDRSIENPNIFVETNVIGTVNLLNASLKKWKENEESSFKFVHVSTDEVYGSLKEDDPAFTEKTPLMPNSPYSSSKAASDLMARSYYETYKLPVMITRCSNNYGPLQFPEKLIPLMISKALKEEKLPVYGTGKNIRDWIYVDDHNNGIWRVFQKGVPGESYNFGGEAERRNIEVVQTILKILGKDESLIEFVTDRKGHDWRYAIDFQKAKTELEWEPRVSFEEGIRKTVQWYLENKEFLA